MGKLLYNGIMKRWLYGAEIDENPNNPEKIVHQHSALFKDGYDDPTYMTFKIEFGDWGASVLDRSIIQAGTTIFRPSQEDYDALPIGLLNCPAPGDSNNAYWQNGANTNHQTFNNTRLYSAFQYLRSRNEDTRAKYLYYFVNGLFEIQKQYPFIFKKISGVNALDAFNPTDGQRLKTPAKITLECYEGLDLKIRTLFEFYRKAAWDDVYQRWILPENMREFKMIIYVFERRIFQDMKRFSDDVKVKGAFATYSSLNADIPVKAYECCPCEFSIQDSISWNNDYSSASDNAEETSKLVINVKNVKTYYKNGLLKNTLSRSYDANGKNIADNNDLTQKIDSILIYDLVESIERSKSIMTDNETETMNNQTIYSNITVNTAKALFLNKNILLENEEANPQINAYIWGHGYSPETGSVYTNADIAAGIDVTKIIQDSINAISPNIEYESSDKKAFDDARKDAAYKTAQEMSQFIQEFSKIRNDILDNDDHLFADPHYEQLIDNTPFRGGWIYSLTQGPAYDPNKSFWGNLGDNIKNVLTGTRRLILMSGAADILSIPYCLPNTYYIPPQIFEPIDNYKDTLGHLKVKDPNLGIRNIDETNFIEIEPEREIPEQQFGELDSRYISEQQFSELTNRQVPDQEFNEIEPERKIPDQQFSELTNRQVPNQGFSELSEREVPDQDFRPLNDPREIPEQQFGELDSRETIDHQYKEIEPEREIPEQQFGELDSRETIKQKFRELDKEREPNDDLIDLVLLTRTLPGFKNMPLDEIRKIPKQELLKLQEATDRSIPSVKANKSVILDEISKIEGTNIKLLELDKGNKTMEDRAFELLKQNNALSNFKLGDNKDSDNKAKNINNIMEFTQGFVKNSDKVKKVYVKSVLEMKDQLKNVTKEIVNKLPIQDTYIVKKGEKDNNNINSVLASKNDIDQINHNMKYLAINDNDVPKLSFQTLIQLHEELGEALQRSQAVEGLTAITKNSVATNPDQKTREKAKHSVIKDAPKKKIEVIY